MFRSRFFTKFAISFLAVYNWCTARGLYTGATRTSILGTVTDNSGATTPQADVRIMNKATNTATHVVTTGSGEFNAPNLSPGTYRVEVAVPGFSTFVEDNLTLTAGATVRADAQLRIGQLSESVEVKAQPIQMQTEDSKVSSAVQN